LSMELRPLQNRRAAFRRMLAGVLASSVNY
jgi:hypothetical protein